MLSILMDDFLEYIKIEKRLLRQGLRIHLQTILNKEETPLFQEVGTSHLVKNMEGYYDSCGYN